MYLFLKNDLVKITTNKLEYLFLCPQIIRDNKRECSIDMRVLDLVLKNKIVITQKCFDNLIEANKIANIEINWKTMFENNYCCDVSVVINLMYNYGFAITQDHFKKMIKNRLYIDNYKKYKLEITKEIEDISNEVLYYPYKEIKVTDVGYKKMMKYNVKHNELIKIQKKFNLQTEYKIDDLEVTCSRENVDLKMVEFLIKDCKIEPNFKCVSNLIKRDKISKRAATCANFILDMLKKKYEK
jgi:hypothetical protein